MNDVATDVLFTDATGTSGISFMRGYVPTGDDSSFAQDADVREFGGGVAAGDFDGDGLVDLFIMPIRTMMNHATTQVFMDDVGVPAENLISKEGQGFRYILDGMNAERTLIAGECIGDGRWFIDKASTCTRSRQSPQT